MATSKLEIYKIDECGTIVEVLHGGDCKLMCGSGGEMAKLTENTTDAAQEKHVPVIEKAGDGIKVKVGSVAHPMEEKHYIEWIEVFADGKACRQFLAPGDGPEAAYECCAEGASARAYCNIHGLWKGGE